MTGLVSNIQKICDDKSTSDEERYYLSYLIAQLVDYEKKVAVFHEALKKEDQNQPQFSQMREDFLSENSSNYISRLNCVLKTGAYDHYRHWMIPNSVELAPPTETLSAEVRKESYQRARLFFSTGNFLTTIIEKIHLEKIHSKKPLSSTSSSETLTFFDVFHQASDLVDSNHIDDFQLFIVQTFLFLIVFYARETNLKQSKIILEKFYSKHEFAEAMCSLSEGDESSLKGWLGLKEGLYQSILSTLLSTARSMGVSIQHVEDVKFISMLQNIDRPTSYFVGLPSAGAYKVYHTIHPVSNWDCLIESEEKTNVLVKCVDQFIERGFSTAVYGPPSLFYAIKKQNVPDIETIIAEDPSLLSKSYCSVEKECNDYSPLQYAVHSGSVKVIEKLFELAERYEVNLNLQNQGPEPLFLACSNNDVEAVAILLQNKATFGDYEKKSKHPLFQAIRDKKLGVVKAIIESNKEFLEFKDENQKTPLFIATEANAREIVNYLLGAGANFNLVCAYGKDKDLCTPYDVSALQNNQEIQALFRDKGAKSNLIPSRDSLLQFKTWDDFINSIQKETMPKKRSNYLNFFSKREESDYLVKQYFITDANSLRLSNLLSQILGHEKQDLALMVVLIVNVIIECNKNKLLTQDAKNDLNESLLFLMNYHGEVKEAIDRLNEELNPSYSMDY